MLPTKAMSSKVKHHFLVIEQLFNCLAQEEGRKHVLLLLRCYIPNYYSKTRGQEIRTRSAGSHVLWRKEVKLIPACLYVVPAVTGRGLQLFREHRRWNQKENWTSGRLKNRKPKKSLKAKDEDFDTKERTIY